MTTLARETSPQTYARVGGALYLFIIGEASLCLWLLMKGVNVEKWNRWRVNSEARSAP